MRELQFTVPAEQSGKRIDSWLAEQIEGLTRSAAQNLLSEQAVSCNGQPLKKNYKLVGSEAITVQLPELKEVDLKPENIPLDIVYEDADIVVVNKPRGMVVHPAAGNWDGTLVNALMYHCGDSLSGINGEHRPGIVHRIDKDTSGLLVVAKNDAAHQSLAAQIAAHTAYRGYEAIVVGSVKDDTGTVDKPIARHKTDRKKMAIVEGGRESAILDYYQGMERLTLIPLRYANNDTFKNDVIMLSSNDITATHIWHFSSRPDVHTRFVYIWHLLVIRLSVIRCTD